MTLSWAGSGGLRWAWGNCPPNSRLGPGLCPTYTRDASTHSISSSSHIHVTLFGLDWHFGPLKKNQNRCDWTHLLGSKYTKNTFTAGSSP